MDRARQTNKMTETDREKQRDKKKGKHSIYRERKKQTDRQVNN